MNFKYLPALILLILFLNTLDAQITFSPYTIFAAGQIESEGSGSNHAMGGTGIALKSGQSLNNINPASYGGIDSLSFLFDIGVFGKYSKFSTTSASQSAYGGNFRYIAMGFRLNKWWMISFGAAPYSSVSYKINTTSQLEGEPSIYFKVYTGSGGINQYYLGTAIKPIPNLSLGINFSYLMGSIEQTENVSSTQGLLYIIDKTSKVHNLYADYGVQYTIGKKDWKYTIGAIYGNKKILKSASEYKMVNSADTVNLGNIDQEFLVPQKFGIGFAVEKSIKFKAGIDYERREWSAVKFTNPLLQTRNSDRLSIGFEYNPYKTHLDKGLKRCFYRIGANYNRSYLLIDKQPIDSKAITFGMGIPLKKQLTMINVSFEIGQDGTTAHGLIQENYYLIHVNFSLHDIWFQKPKYN